MKNQRIGQPSEEVWKYLPPTASYKKETTGGIDMVELRIGFAKKNPFKPTRRIKSGL